MSSRHGCPERVQRCCWLRIDAWRERDREQVVPLAAVRREHLFDWRISVPICHIAEIPNRGSSRDARKSHETGVLVLSGIRGNAGAHISVRIKRQITDSHAPADPEGRVCHIYRHRVVGDADAATDRERAVSYVDTT